jgi:hypothetical protein
MCRTVIMKEFNYYQMDSTLQCENFLIYFLILCEIMHVVVIFIKNFIAFILFTYCSLKLKICYQIFNQYSKQYLFKNYLKNILTRKVYSSLEHLEFNKLFKIAE